MTRRRRATQNRSSQAGRPAGRAQPAAGCSPAAGLDGQRPAPVALDCGRLDAVIRRELLFRGSALASPMSAISTMQPSERPTRPVADVFRPRPSSSAHRHRRPVSVFPRRRQASAVPGHPACRPRNPRSGPSLHHQERRPAASLHPAVALPRIDRREGFAGGTWLPASSVARRPRQIAPGRARDVVFVGAAKLTQAPLSDPRRAPWAHPAPAGPRDRGTERGGVGVRSASGGRRPVRRTPTPCLSAS